MTTPVFYTLGLLSTMFATVFMAGFLVALPSYVALNYGDSDPKYARITISSMFATGILVVLMTITAFFWLHYSPEYFERWACLTVYGVLFYTPFWVATNGLIGSIKVVKSHFKTEVAPAWLRWGYGFGGVGSALWTVVFFMVLRDASQYDMVLWLTQKICLIEAVLCILLGVTGYIVSLRSGTQDSHEQLRLF